MSIHTILGGGEVLTPPFKTIAINNSSNSNYINGKNINYVYVKNNNSLNRSFSKQKILYKYPDHFDDDILHLYLNTGGLDIISIRTKKINSNFSYFWLNDKRSLNLYLKTHVPNQNYILSGFTIGHKPNWNNKYNFLSKETFFNYVIITFRIQYFFDHNFIIIYPFSHINNLRSVYDFIGSKSYSNYTEDIFNQNISVYYQLLISLDLHINQRKITKLEILFTNDYSDVTNALNI